MDVIVSKYERTKEKVLANLLNPVQKLLPASLIEQYCRDRGYGWRERDLGPAITLLACIWKHLQSSLLSARATEDYLVSLQSESSCERQPGKRAGSNFCKARKRLPEDIFKKRQSMSRKQLTTDRLPYFMACVSA